MLTIQIRNSFGELSLNLPERPGEVKLSQALKFNYAYEQLVKWRSKELPQDQLTFDTIVKTYNKKEYLLHVINCCTEFFGVPKEKFLGIKRGSIKEHILNLSKANLTPLAESLLSIFLHVYGVTNQYKPKLRSKDNCSFEHKGRKYFIPAFLVDALNEIETEDLTVSQSIECLEVVRLIREHKKDPKKVVSAAYTEIISVTSILARAEGEVFPESQVEINRYIQRRQKVFADIDMETGLDLSFFLSGIILN